MKAIISVIFVVSPVNAILNHVNSFLDGIEDGFDKLTDKFRDDTVEKVKQVLKDDDKFEGVSDFCIVHDCHKKLTNIDSREDAIRQGWDPKDYDEYIKYHEDRLNDRKNHALPTIQEETTKTIRNAPHHFTLGEKELEDENEEYELY